MAPLPSSADILNPGSPRILWGPEIGLNYNFFSSTQDGVANALTGFEDLIGTDNDLQRSLGGYGFLAGVAVDIPISSSIGFLGSVHYDSKSVMKTASEIVSGLIYSTDPLMLVDTVREPALQTMNVTIAYLTLNPALRMYIGELYGFIGPAIGIPLWGMASFNSQLPDDASDPLYYNYGTPQQSRSVSIKNPVPGMKARVALDIGVGEYFALTRKTLLAPELDIDYA
ncbi:MAG TPA: outer membrane beta-barrel protein, partial [Candidatus Kapabacteria bacterium]|nr:outer membrane beta-barrel protein [Candidatus Kapabacteria bacterium]